MQKPNMLKLSRIKAGYTQTELAEKLGITPGAVSQWERGSTLPTTKLLRPLSELLEISLDELLKEVL